MARSASPPSATPTRHGEKPQQPPTTTQDREQRGARRKRETREKLLRAAFRLFAERGVDAVAINEITEAADVGFGSFYNHFASKEAVHEAVVDAVFGDFGDTLERLTSDVDDPAEVIAICVRHTILRAGAEPLWGRFFLREGFNPSVMTRGLGARLLRDVHRGIASKRFDPADPMMAFMLAGGCVMATVAAQAAAEEHGATEARRLGFDTKNLAARAAAAVLQALGLERPEAQRISAKPLPRVESPGIGSNDER